MSVATRDGDPLLLTLAFDAASQSRLDALRRAYYPPSMDRVPAHCMLFHALPGTERRAVERTLAAVAARTPAFSAAIAPPRTMGRGVQLPLVAPELDAVHAELVRAWTPWLTAQDLQGFRPHVVVQNKVAPDVARAALAELARTALPDRCAAVGLGLWYYRGGPWEPVRTFAFTGPAAERAGPGD